MGRTKGNMLRRGDSSCIFCSNIRVPYFVPWNASTSIRIFESDLLDLT